MIEHENCGRATTPGQLHWPGLVNQRPHFGHSHMDLSEAACLSDKMTIPADRGKASGENERYPNTIIRHIKLRYNQSLKLPFGRSIIMSKDASEFVQALLNDGEAVGFIPGGALGKVLQAWEAFYGSEGYCGCACLTSLAVRIANWQPFCCRRWGSLH
jgi:hypothetical protein